MFDKPLVKTPTQDPAQSRPANSTEHQPVKANHSVAAPFAKGQDFSLVPPSAPVQLSRGAPATALMYPRLQPKLRVSSPDDPEEKEADEVAKEVTDDLSVSFSSGSGSPVPPDDDSGSDNRGDDWWNDLHRSISQNRIPEVDHDFRERLHTRLDSGAELPTQVRSDFEAGFGTSFAHVRVHGDSHAASLSDEVSAHAFTYGRHIFFASGQFAPESPQGRRLLAHELTHVVQQRRGPNERVQRQPKQPKQVATTMTITIGEEVTGEEFKIRALMQFLQVDRDAAIQQTGAWKATGTIIKNGITADKVNKPIAVTFHGAAMSSGERAAEDKRTAAVNALPPDQKKEVNDEVDRRFWQHYQYKPGSALGKGKSEEGMRDAWLRTRDGVLGDQEKVATLQPKIQNFLTADGKRRIKPEEFKTTLRIADKLKDFTTEDWQLYERRINASTEDFEILERSIDAFKAKQAGEKQVRDRIAGKEALYQQVKDFESLQRSMMIAHPGTDTVEMDRPGNLERYVAASRALDASLKANGFNTVEEFKASNKAYLELFQARGVELTMLVLQASERTVATERKRYEDPKVVEDLFAKLAPFRAAMTEADDAARASMPSPMQLKMDSPSTKSQDASLERSIEAGKQAESSRKDLAAQHPMLKDPKLSSYSLAARTPAELGNALRKNADDRQESIVKTRVAIKGEPEKIFKLDQIVALTRQELQVAPNSIYAMVVEDHQNEVSITDVLLGIAVGALAIGLGVLSFGTGTVAVLAGVGALTLSVGGALQEYDKYEEGMAAAHTDFDTALSVSSEDPSAVWLAVALLSIGLDGIPLAKAFKAALPAAKLLNEAGGAARFEAELAKATELSEGIRKAVTRAKDSQAKYLEALEELAEAKRTAPGRLHSGPDSEVFNKRVKVAYYAIQKGFNKFEIFMRELKLGKLAKSFDLTTLTEEELKAWEKAFATAEGKVAADAAKFSVRVPFQKAGEKLVTFDESGKMLLNGKAVTKEEYKNIYKNLDLGHVLDGHGPQRPLVDVMNEAKVKLVGGKITQGLSGRFSTDEVLLQSVERARAAWTAKPNPEVFLDALPNDGRAFADVSKVPAGAQTMLPFDAPPGVVEIQVKRVLAAFRPDGSLISIYPVGF